MGIYDREYYRREGPSILNSLWPTGIVCQWLIGINIVVFIVQLLTFDQTKILDWNQGATGWLALNTDLVLQGQIWRLFTSAFLHDPTSWQHIVFNMVFLWWFGSELERLYGPREFLAYYLTASVLSGLAFLLWALATGPSIAMGASGAVTAVLILFVFHFPHRTVLLFFILPVPVWVLAVVQVAQDSFAFFGNIRTGVAVAAHLGGALFALLYYLGGWRLTGWWRGWDSFRRRGDRRHLRLYHPEAELKEPVAVPASSMTGVDEHLEAKVDALLEKMSRQGQASLTEHERQILLKASELYRRKRT